MKRDLTRVYKLADIRADYSFEAPLISAAIPAGYGRFLKREPGKLDLNQYLGMKPDSTYLVRVNGDSMIDENIFDGDILIIDAKEEPADGKIVIAALNGEMAVKTLRRIDGRLYLYSANKNFLPIEIGPYMQFDIQGIVKHVIHPLV